MLCISYHAAIDASTDYSLDVSQMQHLSVVSTAYFVAGVGEPSVC